MHAPSYQCNNHTLTKVLLQCTSRCLPAGFVADTRQVIDKAKGVEIAFVSQYTIPMPAATMDTHAAEAQD